jgi:hypothetical protein
VIFEVNESGEEEAEEGSVLGKKGLGRVGFEVEEGVGEPDLEEPDEAQTRHHRGDRKGL